jgi:molecular chaperone GrpE
MTKMSDAQKKAKKILENMENESSSHTEVHVENHSEQTLSSGDQSAELTADLQRVQAEFQNYKRRVEGEKAEVLDFAKNRVVREFLAVRDSFDQEAMHRPKSVDPKWADSINSIRLQFDQVLKSLGVERFESKGHPFDPHIHEAVSMEDGEGDHEIVVEELQAGYRLGDHILRPAIVKVGKSKS